MRGVCPDIRFNQVECHVHPSVWLWWVRNSVPVSGLTNKGTLDVEISGASTSQIRDL